MFRIQIIIISMARCVLPSLKGSYRLCPITRSIGLVQGHDYTFCRSRGVPTRWRHLYVGPAPGIPFRNKSLLSLHSVRIVQNSPEEWTPGDSTAKSFRKTSRVASTVVNGLVVTMYSILLICFRILTCAAKGVFTRHTQRKNQIGIVE